MSIFYEIEFAKYILPYPFSKYYLPKMKQQTQREFAVSLIIYQKNPYINLFSWQSQRLLR